jgi:L-asparaginase
MVRQGIIVVVSSQCLFEKSDFSVYQVGRKTLEAGVIEARDMTTEATVTKLMWVLAQTTDSAEVARKFKTVYFGEMTI